MSPEASKGNPEFRIAVKKYLMVQDRTQVWLADQIGLDPTGLSRVLRGERRQRKSVVLNISNVLGLPEDER